MAVSLLTICNTVFAINAFDKGHTAPPEFVTSITPFQKIIINNGIDLVLYEGTENLIEIKGGQKDVARVNYYIHKGILYIESRQGTLQNKVVVYLSVQQLQGIEVNGKSKISSNGFLNSDKLNLVVNDEAKFELKIRGEIFIESDESIDLHVEQWKGPNQPNNKHFNAVFTNK